MINFIILFLSIKMYALIESSNVKSNISDEERQAELEDLMIRYDDLFKSKIKQSMPLTYN